MLLLRCNLATLILMLVLLPACQSLEHTSVAVSDVEPLLRGDGILTEAQQTLPIESLLPTDDPFYVSPEMVAFVEFYAPPDASTSYRAKWLLKALMGSSGLALEYRPMATTTAKQTFHSGQANCLSFTILYGALAEKIGLDVDYVDVDTPPVWDMLHEDSWVNYKHVNLKVKQSFGNYLIVDINMEDYSPKYQQVAISKNHLLALYFANVGVEVMYQGDTEKAFLYLRKSLELQPQLGLAWVNLGVLYKRNGKDQYAELAYRRALTVDSGEISAAGNLVRLLKSQQRNIEAAIYEDYVAFYRNKNPYYHFSLAEWLLEQGDATGAEESLQKAMRMEDDHRFYWLKARIMAHKGDLDGVLDNIELAASAADDISQKYRYESKYDKLQRYALQ